MKKGLVGLCVIAALVFIAMGAFYAIYMRPFMENATSTQNVKYDKNLSLVLGGGGNSGVYTYDDIVIVIDSKRGVAAESLATKVKRVAGEKPILVVNTHHHPDHTGGNAFYKGQAILAGGNYTKSFWAKRVDENVLPTIWLKNDTNIIRGKDTLSIFELGRNIHTESDVFVYDHKRKILFTGDVVVNKQNVFILDSTNPNNYLWALDELEKRCDIEIVVPGHGTIGGPYVIDSFRQYFLDMKAAAANTEKRDSLIDKYKEWKSIPFFISPDVTTRSFNK